MCNNFVCLYTHKCTVGSVFFYVISVGLRKDSPRSGGNKCWWEGGKNATQQMKRGMSHKAQLKVERKQPCTCWLWVPPHRPDVLHFRGINLTGNKNLGMQERAYGLWGTAAMGTRNSKRFPKMYALLAVYWTISRVAQGRNSSDIIWFCLHFIKKQFTFSNGSCLKDLLSSLVSSSINGSFLLLLNLTTSGSGIVRPVQGCEECARRLSEIRARCRDHTRQRQESLTSDTPCQAPCPTFGALLLFMFVLRAFYTSALWHGRYFLLCRGWKSPCSPWYT